MIVTLFKRPKTIILNPIMLSQCAYDTMFYTIRSNSTFIVLLKWLLTQ